MYLNRFQYSLPIFPRIFKSIHQSRITAEQYSKLQKKRARNSVPKCPCKLLQPADRPMAGSSSLEGHFGTGLRARFSSAWSNVGCGVVYPIKVKPLEAGVPEQEAV